MSASLPPDLEQFVEHQVSIGKYRSKEDVLSEGVRLLKERESRLDELRKQAQIGLDQLERGEVIDLGDKSVGDFLDEIEAEVEKELAVQEELPHEPL